MAADAEPGGVMAARRVLVVGGSTGIGRATAGLIAAQGGRVAIIARHQHAVDACAAACGAVGLIADMRDEAQADAAVASAAEQLGGLDGLVNCIGNSEFAPLQDITLAAWNETLLVNLTTHFLACRAALPHLRAAGQAAIVNVSAIAGVMPGVAGAGYAAAKAGVIQFTKNLAAQLAPAIRVNAVSPGAVRTQRMIDNFLATRSEAQVEAFVARYSQKRLSEPEEIAATIVFLLSHQASSITGSNVVADGGRAFR